MNTKQLDGLESEELDERPMTRKLTKIPSVVDLLKSSDSSKEYSESETVQTKKRDNRMSINLCEALRVEDNGPTRKTTAVKEDSMSFSST